ncbi:MAG TPA: anaerobic ribonucleoside-triphosphate reductase, partial [Desulfobacteria bacterium]|nr:anaerobic ribonucleoside-triphosphate reductase [Desulfobacteria bacterium]
AKMLQIASAASKRYYLSRLIPEVQAQAHATGDIHIHDLDFYGKTLTCVQIPLGKLLKEGFDNGHGYIRSPKRPASATALAAIILQSSQNDMHGGQAFPFFDTDIAEFVKDANENEIYQAMEAFIYNLNSMHSRAGAQVPFSSLNIGTDTSPGARSVVKNLLLAYEKGLGRGENPIFPNIIFRLKEGINLNEGDPNYDLFKLAIRVAARRLNPTFSFMDSSFNSPYGTEVCYMGCRTRVIGNVNGPEIAEGRGNLSFTTINLPRVAIKAGTNIDKFYRELEKIINLSVEQLHHRFTVQAKLKVRDMPFLMGQGLWIDSKGLKPDDYIEDVIKHGTLSVGFIGLAEALTVLTGKHHGESQDANELGMQIVEFMRKMMDDAAEKYQLNYSLLATPAEGLSGRFVRMDQKEFGDIPGITDREYYTNSFHVPVDHDISLFDKVSIEGPYHKYCNAGHISYVEFPSPPIHNLDAIEAVLRHMKDSDIGYAGINFPVDYCIGCSYTGVINQDDCPMCGCPEIKRVRRITGYLSTVDRFNDAKQAELKDRKAHRLMDRE